jgi:hypothetical protein
VSTWWTDFPLAICPRRGQSFGLEGMATMTQNNFTRKEIADMLGVSVRTLIRREKEWGLDRCRSNASISPYLFFRKRTLEILKEHGLIAGD